MTQNVDLEIKVIKKFIDKTGKLPQKQYSLKVDKLFNFKTVKHEKKHIYTCPDCRYS